MDDTDPLRGSQRVFKTQLLLCSWIGVSSFVFFCFLRFRWPHIYAIRTLRKSTGIKRVSHTVFAWVAEVWRTTDDDVLRCSGLDAYVFLSFFKMGMTIFLELTVLAVGILSPVRYYFTGHYDKDDWEVVAAGKSQPPDFSDDFPGFLWVYPIFTYVFSVLIYVNMFTFTRKVIKTRQKYLASQNSITDRTIKIDGIPKRLVNSKTTEILKTFIEDLGVGTVQDIKMIYDWAPLDSLVRERRRLVGRIERYYAKQHRLRIDIYNAAVPSVALASEVSALEHGVADPRLLRYIGQLESYDDRIKHIQDKYKRLIAGDNNVDPDDLVIEKVPSAFVTMDSVASAQMAAQTVLDPRVYKLMVNLAPAPKDIKWENLKLTYYQKLLKSNLITIAIVLSYIPILFLVSSLATLLDLKSITKFWPALGEFIGQSKWLTTFVTGILPPLLYSLLNVSMPYFYRYLSQCQGYSSNSEVELSTLSKNFFYIFFNLFLVFIITGTIWDYISFMQDTTKIAYQLATSLKKKSLFYVDLILLQGLAMFPVRLLQIGDVVLLNLVNKLFLIKNILLRTPRDYRFYYYTPPVFDFGIQLPQHILIFIIILIYSVVSTKIVASGLVYFVLGYLVYKYQLIYNYVHPPHSTGKIWPMVFRRLVLGLVIFQLFMCGTLALEGAVLPSVLCSPLVVVTLLLSWNYEKYFLPLNNFIALRAIQSPLDFDKEFDDNDEYRGSDDSSSSVIGQSTMIDGANETSMLVNCDSSAFIDGDYTVDEQRTRRRRISTVDEEREEFSTYMYPYLNYELDGPLVAFEGDTIDVINYNDPHDLELGEVRQTLIRKTLAVAEWE